MVYDRLRQSSRVIHQKVFANYWKHTCQGMEAVLDIEEATLEAIARCNLEVNIDGVTCPVMEHLYQWVSTGGSAVDLLSVVNILCKMGSATNPREIAKSLIERLENRSNERNVRNIAARALGFVGAKGDSETVRLDITQALLSCLEDAGEYPTVRSAAAEALGAIGAKGDSTTICKELLGKLTDQDLSLRRAVIRALGFVGAQINSEAVRLDITQALLSCLEDAGEDPTVRRASISALGFVGAKGDSETICAPIGRALLSCLEDAGEYPTVRSAAAEALGIVGAKGDSEAICKELLGKLTDQDLSLRRAAIRALGVLGTQINSETICNALLGKLVDADKDPTIRSAVAVALGGVGAKINHETVCNTLIRWLADQDKDISEASARALGSIGISDQVAAVCTALLIHLKDEEEDGFVRRAAAESLGTLQRLGVRLFSPHSEGNEAQNILYSCHELAAGKRPFYQSGPAPIDPTLDYGRLQSALERMIDRAKTGDPIAIDYLSWMNGEGNDIADDRGGSY